MFRGKISFLSGKPTHKAGRIDFLVGRTKFFVGKAPKQHGRTKFFVGKIYFWVGEASVYATFNIDKIKNKYLALFA